MTYYVGAMPVGDHLEHHGIKGMRWGQRRFQNDDGSLTALGRARYGVSNAYGRVRGRVNTARNDIRRAGGVKAASTVSRRVIKQKANKAGANVKNFYKKNKKAIKIGAAVAGTAAAAALGYKYRKQIGAAAKRLGGKTFPAGTKRAQMLSSAKYRYGMAGGAKGIAKNAFGKARGAAGRVKGSVVNTRNTPWMARGVESSVSKNVAKANAKAVSKRVSSQINEAFNAGKIRNLKAKKATKALNRAAKNVSRSSGIAAIPAKTGKYPGWVKDTAKNAAAKAAGSVRNAGKSVGGKAKNVYSAAKNRRANKKFVKYATRTMLGPDAYRKAKIANYAYRGVMGGLYGAHAHAKGASNKQAIGVGASRAVGGMLVGQAVGAGVGVYNRSKKRSKKRTK